MFTHHTFGSRNIPADLQNSEGRALSLWRDAGWGQLVATGKYETGRFTDELVKACVEMMRQWNPAPAPRWVTCIPSHNYPTLIPEFAQRLAAALDLKFVPCIKKVRENQQQKFMENSFQQARNLDGTFHVALEPKAYSPCLLIDDTVDSRWTFTVAGALLRQVGCRAVYPLALALNSPRMD
jgi:ATP-dependent DNA helicase RecQ